MKKCAILILAAAAAMCATAVQPANRAAQVDADGVLRWADDNSEVAMVGVNYYPPFAIDHAELKRLGADIPAVMREDVAHFRRLGLGCVRIHCFERQFSTPDGAFVENEHARLMDELVAICATNGLYMVFTPIAWWHAGAGPTDGFSDRFPMREMTSNADAWKIQARFLENFASRVNSFTGRRYADEPSILAFECINEPIYPAGWPDAKATEYVNALVDGLRASGTKKPVFYNAWLGRAAAVGASRADGATGVYYPTGLVAGHALRGSQLGRIRASTFHENPAALSRKAKMVYEFDAADTPGSYMYPALGRLFRSEGVQVASMFQYDPMCLANYNRNWMTHYLNLVYTPRKALSIAIMAEVFRRVPRGCAYAPDARAIEFPPFRVDGERDLSEYAGTDAYYYTNDPVAPPPDAAALRRVWGCGASSVAASTGSGAYFLDRAAPGVWRLQLYPSVFETADPYTGRNAVVKRIVLPDSPRVTLRLPGLGANWCATPVADRSRRFTAQSDASALLPPGDYVVTRAAPTAEDFAAALAADVPPFIAPPPEKPATRATLEIPRQWAVGKDLPFEMETHGATNAALHFVSGADGTRRTVGAIPANGLLGTAGMSAGVWGVCADVAGPHGRIAVPAVRTEEATVAIPRRGAAPVSLLPPPGAAIRGSANGVSVDVARRPDGAFELRSEKSAVKNACGGFEADLPKLPRAKGPTAIVLDVENLSAGEARFEVGFRLDRGGFGVNAAVRPGRSRIVFGPDRIVPLWGGPAEERPWERVRGISVLTGAWLWPDKSVPAQRVVVRNVECVEAEVCLPLDLRASPSEWELLDPVRLMRASLTRGDGKSLVQDDRGEPAFQCWKNGFADGASDSTGLKTAADTANLVRAFPSCGPGRTIVIRARATFPHTDKLEVAFCQNDGRVWGTVVPLTGEWREIRVPVASLRYFSQWGLPPIPETERPDLRKVDSFNFCFGRWLFPKTAGETHGFAISSIKVED